MVNHATRKGVTLLTVENHPKIPKYWKLTEQLRRRIERGELRPGDRMLSRAQMQQQFAVSPGTAEKVFAELEKIGLIVREQGRGTFVAQPARKATDLIGFVGRAFAGRKINHANAEIIAGVEDALATAHKRMVLLDSHSPAGWDQVEGVLACVPDEELLQAELHHRAADMPCVSLLLPSRDLPSVVADDFGGAKAAVEHLLRLGHRRIACLMEKGPALSQQRLAGYNAALYEADIQPPAAWMRTPQIAFDVEIGYRQWGRANMQNWLRAGWRQTGCTALLAQNDLAAVGAVEVLQEAGFAVPGAVSVLGFDSAAICDCVTPRLSAIAVPMREIGRRGCELLLRYIKGEIIEPETIVLPTHVQERETTAPPHTRSTPATAKRVSKIAIPDFAADRTSLLRLLEGVH